MTLRLGLKPELPATPQMPKHGYQRAWSRRPLADAAYDLFSLPLQGWGRIRPPPDPESRSPGAAVALGAPGKDQLGRQVTSKNSLFRNLPQALIGSNFGSRRKVADDVINHADGVGGGL